MVLSGVMEVLGNPLTMFLIFAGTGVGIIFGSIPGLTATMAVTMFLPMTYAMSPVAAISVLMGLYIGGTSGGLLAAILLKIPGTPASVATCFDGGPMADRGEAGKAIGAGIVYSFLGTVFGLILMFFIAPLLAKLAIKFGPFEYCALAIFSLSLVVMLTGRDMVKGLISALMGIMLATVGLAPIDSAKRFTFGNAQLNDGFQLLTLLIGLYAFSEILDYAENIRNPQKIEIQQNYKMKGFGFSWKEFVFQTKNFIYSALIGTGMGILPGIGGGTSGMLAYTFVKNRSKYPEKFGTGVLDGVVASETANNATIGGAMIPLLTLGIPGDGTTAILLGALMVHSVSPGPLIFAKNGAVVYGIYTAMLVSAIAMLILEFICMKGFIKVLKVPKQFLLPVVIILCCIGAFGNSNRIFDIWGVLIFGLLGYLMSKSKLPLPPIILGFILGPIFETNFRRASQYLVMNPWEWMNHPIAIVFIIVTILGLWMSLRKMTPKKPL